MSDIQGFIARLEPELDGLPEGTLTPDTVFRDMPEWNSMYALIIMAFASTEYGVDLSGEDLSTIECVRDLFNCIQGLT